MKRIEGKSIFCSRLDGVTLVTYLGGACRQWAGNNNSRHAQDSGVELQGPSGVLDPQHRLLQHEVLHAHTRSSMSICMSRVESLEGMGPYN